MRMMIEFMLINIRMLIREIIGTRDINSDESADFLLSSSKMIRAGWNVVKSPRASKAKPTKRRKPKAVHPLRSVVVKPPKPFKWN